MALAYHLIFVLFVYGEYTVYFWGLSAPMLVTLSPIDSWQLFILGIGTPIAVLPRE